MLNINIGKVDLKPDVSINFHHLGVSVVMSIHDLQCLALLANDTIAHHRRLVDEALNDIRNRKPVSAG